MSYTVNPTAWSAAFPVPSQIVDTHIKMAGATQLKALLWILRHSSEAVDIERLAKAIGQKPADTVDALHYWVECGVLLADDCAAPLPAPPRVESSESVKEKSKKEPARAYEQEKTKTLESIPVTAPTSEQIADRACESSEIRFLFNEAQQKLGRTIGHAGQCTLLMMHDQYGLPVEVILMILEYAVTTGKIAFSYISALGKDWGERDIDTIEKADLMITRLRTGNRLWAEFARGAGIDNSKPTAKQLTYITRWANEFGFTTEMILLAHDEMAEHCRSLSLPYMDKVLANWHANGVKTPEDMEKAKQERTASRSTRKGKRADPSGEASYDLNEFERGALHDPIVYEKRKK